MPPKRKSNAIEADASAGEDAEQVVKKPRVSDAPEASGSKDKKAKQAAEPKDWHDIVLEGEGEDGGVSVYDDCNDIRRKIRLLQKQPNWKVTAWLKEIGNINSNSFQRFMKATGPTGGASNGTYYAAYVYFEKVRIAEGKKKTAKRERSEAEHREGLPLQDRRGVWVYTGP
ncbi:hypothetical protein POSPLADRAFT_1051806 [Postia placenta MAD-698-R-SB12]|uniref:DUF7726 domain-containing protein n=1 Tax=Postia placenta MAD-698-R-SB12 TaxID=670580 RepID=A0A1X6NGB8_9APHY|nr:hypothetical protein POSPLADRAFT_1051806 [Postia placenta MAD-698-R-SB12]OSX67677.1 hypothetical protein POSPLADRAFT_1051806 [Postia placenta MAD-698-R-SB12]